MTAWNIFLIAVALVVHFAVGTMVIVSIARTIAHFNPNFPTPDPSDASETGVTMLLAFFWPIVLVGAFIGAIGFSLFKMIGALMRLVA